MLVHRRVTPSIKFAGTHLYTWVERGTVGVKCLTQEHNTEGRERVKWELGFAFFRGWEMGFCPLGLGFMKKNRKMGMGFQFEQHRLGLWDLSWDLKKHNFLGNGIRTPPSRPSTQCPWPGLEPGPLAPE